MSRLADPLRLCQIAALLLLTCSSVAQVAAQGWPDRPLTMVIPYARGGPADMVGRLLAPRLGAILGQPVLVENIAGTIGIAGVSQVAKAAPDGYQFVLGNVATHAQYQFLFTYPPYDAMAEFVPAALVVDQAMLLAVRPDLPVADLSEFVAHLRANPSRIQYGSAGAGSATHLACALLNSALNVEVRHVPYRSGSLAMRGLLSGQVDYSCGNVSAIRSDIEAGRLKALMVLSRARLPCLPFVATAREQGLKDFEASNWMALFLPAATPEPIVARLNAAAVTALADPKLRAKLHEFGIESVSNERNTPEWLGVFMAAEHDRWGAIIRRSHIRLE
jgi:tripartite-type tricarboxylate transporter receptor subunit TctC